VNRQDAKNAKNAKKGCNPQDPRNGMQYMVLSRHSQFAPCAKATSSAVDDHANKSAQTEAFELVVHIRSWRSWRAWRFHAVLALLASWRFHAVLALLASWRFHAVLALLACLAVSRRLGALGVLGG